MVTDIFSSMVFDDATMEARLPKETYKTLQRTIKLGKHLDLNVATVFIILRYSRLLASLGKSSRFL